MSRIIEFIKKISVQVLNYISGAVTRIFSVRDDDYPATGVQPFEGERPKKRDL